MITQDVDDLPVQSGFPVFGRDLLSFHTAVKAKVSQIVYHILGFDPRIPISDQTIIHCLNVREGPTTVSNDIGMAQVEVGC